MSLMDQSAFDIARKIQRGELAAVDVLDAALERIAAVDGSRVHWTTAHLHRRIKPRYTLSSPDCRPGASSRLNVWMPGSVPEKTPRWQAYRLPSRTSSA